jgi:DNA polymerase I-like protein with 3'-5' exonuclease and polymerase domains
MPIPPPDLLLPHSNWTPPAELPDLSAAKVIAIDVETRDPELLTRGPGFLPGGSGYIVGISYHVEGGPTGYLPTDHAEGTNLDGEAVRRWAKDQLGREGQVKVFHNAAYDLGWLQKDGIDVRGPVRCTQLLAALVDESRRARKRSYTLDDLCADYLGRKKDESLLRDAARVCGLDPKSELWKLPPPFVGPYAEADAHLTGELHHTLWSIIEDQGLEQIAALECGLIRTSLDMRLRGVRVDVPRAEALLQAGDWLEFLARRNVDRAAEGEAVVDLPALETLDYFMAQPGTLERSEPLGPYLVDIWSGRSLANLYDKLGLEYPRTEAGEPSFEKEVLAADPHPVAQAIHVAKRISRAMTYVKTQILGNLRPGGRVHPQWSQLVDDDYGTITGRYSCTRPALQQAPRRDPLVGTLIRSLFLPEEGCTWFSFDYSQQEPRLTVHYADLMGLAGGREAARYYNQCDSADYHEMVANMLAVDRQTAKTINLAISYGMGRGEVGKKLGLTREGARDFWDGYHSKLPFVRELQKAAAKKARVDGYVRTILGRRCRFDLWERKRPFEEKQWAKEAALPRDEAERMWPKAELERAFTYKAISRLIQGSAADQIKMAMLRAADVPGANLLAQIHDELCFSLDLSYPAGRVERIKRIMEEAVVLRVPSRVDVKIGKAWG